MKRLSAVLLSAALALTLCACGSGDYAATSATGTPDPALTAEPTVAPGDDSGLSGLHHVTINVADYGTISLELDADAAPITVDNFLALAGDGFYEGLTFHRIMEGFMMQGGAPNSASGSAETITGEFAANGWDNPISHVRGVISMARATPYNSASSQFFICHADATFLDGQYAAFGKVTEGMDVVDAICTDARPIDDNGTIPAGEQPVITSVEVID